jgi:hypothetical protein
MSLFFSAPSHMIVSLPDNKGYVQNLAAATICTWLVWQSAASSGARWRIVSFGTNTTGSRFSIAIPGAEIDQGKIVCLGRALDADSLSTWTSTNVLLANLERAHIAVVVNFVSRTFSIYKNGAFIETSPAQGWTSGNCANNVNANSCIGSTPQNTDEYFNGGIVDLRLYNRALSANEIAVIAACNGCDGIVQGLNLHTVLNEGNDGAIASGAGYIKDFSPNKNNGTPINSPYYTGTFLKLRKQRV